MDNLVKVFVFVDALGWRQVEKYNFLVDLLPYRRSIEMQFGYSCTAIPTILTGRRPDEHGHLAFYDYAPGRSPFRAMRLVAPFMRPRSLWRRGRVRNQLSKFVKRLYGFTGYFQLYGVPFERLPYLDYCEKRDMFLPGGMSPLPNLADVWTGQGMRWHISDWHLPEDENFRRAEALFRAGAVDRAFVYSAAFDALQHDNVGRDEVLAPKVEAYANSIRSLHAALTESGRPFELTVFSDHGMTPLSRTIDIPAALDGTGMEWGVDYASAIDSTMARFWWLRSGAEERCREALAGFPGHWLTADDERRNGILRGDRKFGDGIFLVDPGVQIVPSDMGVKPLNGMHGYDPADGDSLACWLSTVPVPEGVGRVCDYFGAMTSAGDAGAMCGAAPSPDAPPPRVSILVRAHNDAAHVGDTLDAIFAQKAMFPFETVVCDDSSSDATLAIASRYPVRFVKRPDGPYKPGRTLNAMVRSARGQIVVFNNADAVPRDCNWLERLVAPILADTSANVATFANQLPRPDAMALVRRDSERAFGDGRIHSKWRFFFSLASAAAPRALLLENPFDESIQYSEDVDWAWRLSRKAEAPLSVVYCPDAHVEHSHNYSVRELARRFRGEGAADAVIFGDRPSLVREVAGAVRESVRDVAYLLPHPRHWCEIPYSPIRRITQRVSHWRGTREAAVAARGTVQEDVGR